MATSAAARGTLFALRRKIAKIEGTPADTLSPDEVGMASDGIVLREGGSPLRHPALTESLIATGDADFDAALGGGVPRAALTEIHGAEMRDAGVVTGFALGLCAAAMKAVPQSLPLLWIAPAENNREAGFPYAPGLLELFGISPGSLLTCETPKLADALWVAEEAARLSALGAVLLELRGNPQRVDLTATRRLHFRARDAGRPVFLLRQSARAEPTAAPLRLSISPAPAGMRRTVAGPLSGSIGPPAFMVEIGKSRTARSGSFELEWNSHERSFRKRGPEIPGSVVPVPVHRRHLAPASRPLLAGDTSFAAGAADRQPAREERTADRRPRRAG
ncbi:hypothetical protein ABGN05_08535 [Aquibium sp. LZ166]|uniref:Protein ImuA n=1 Tax=Aquibium pacificus TaxID=3153579 RepID=A0ABV3SG18_9HYPH